jgi:hypothetical protein
MMPVVLHEILRDILEEAHTLSSSAAKDIRKH